jgi:GNAT superfamily N-acetyltransferase
MIDYQPLTPKSWKDFEELFGPRGAYSGCWCMWWRTTRKEFEQCQGDGNKAALRAQVEAGNVPGIIGYHDGRPAAWAAICPREDFPSIGRSRVLKPIDDQPAWSLPCLFVGKDFRGLNLSLGMIEAAIDYVKKQGGKIVEAYPTVPRGKRLPPVSSFMGFPAVFEQAGFEEVARPSEARMIMRRVIG